MGIKQTWVTGFLLALILPVSSLLLAFISSDIVSANYAPTSGKCQDGSDPTEGVVRNRATLCAESTRKTTPPTPQNTDQSQSTTQTGDPVASTDSEEASDVTCAVEKIGWILCPIMEGAAKISDKAFEVLADNFLRTDPELVQDNSGTRIAWGIARDLANIMFIIAFLIIILAQVTGRGLTNYGIKKMMPRLVIAVIAVNVSYFICQLAVDATNILGYEIQNALAQIANTVGPSVFGSVTPADTEGGAGALSNPGILSAIVVGSLAMGAVVWFMLPTIAALIPLILITVSTIIIVLLLRKAFIVLLIVLAPIAFVAYLLPNTEKFFSKWMSMFTKLLLVFPIVGLLFGAGQLASTIILVAGSDQGQNIAAADCNPDNVEDRQKFNTDKNRNDNSICGEGSVNVTGPKTSTAGGDLCGSFAADNGCNANDTAKASWTLGLVATGIAVAPLLAVWAVLKGALSAAGAIGGRISGAVEKGVRGAGSPAAKLSRNGGEALQKRMNANMKAGWQRKQANALGDGATEGLDGAIAGFARRRALRNARLAGSENDLKRQEQMAAIKDGSYADGFSAVGRRTADAANEKLISEEIQAASLEVNQMALGDHKDSNAQGVLNELLNNDGSLKSNVDPNSARTAALIQKAMTAGAGEQKAAIIDAFRRTKDMQGNGSLGARTVASSLQSGANPGYYSASSIDAISRGAADKSAASMTLEGLKGNKFTADKMAAANSDDTAYAKSIADAAAGAGDTIAKELNKRNAAVALNSEQTKSRLGSQKSNLEDMLK